MVARREELLDGFLEDLGEGYDHDLFSLVRRDLRNGVERHTIEKTRMPMGSSLRLPTGNFFCKASSLQDTTLFVDHTMTVHKRSSAESASDAIKLSDCE